MLLTAGLSLLLPLTLQRCLCGAEFCYVCGARWKSCTCAQWEEPRLYARATQILQRNHNPRHQLFQPVRIAREQPRLRRISFQSNTGVADEPAVALGDANSPVSRASAWEEDFSDQSEWEQDWMDETMDTEDRALEALPIALPPPGPTHGSNSMRRTAPLDAGQNSLNALGLPREWKWPNLAPTAPPSLPQEGGSSAIPTNPILDLRSTSPPPGPSSTKDASPSRGIMSLQLAEMIENLRANHNCLHDKWRWIRGPHQCEECHFRLPSYIFQCRQCHLQACNRCRRNRLK